MEYHLEKLAGFNRRMLELVNTNGRCHNCPLCGGIQVGCDYSNEGNGEPGPRSVLFLGLNPGYEESGSGVPFVGKAGRLLRRTMKLAGCESDWGIINCILCYTNNEQSIPNLDACRDQCKPNVAEFVKFFKPKAIIPCGNGALGLFGLDSITKNSRKTFVSKGPRRNAPATLVMPMTHPSSLLRSGGENSPAFSGYVQRLREIMNTLATFNPDAENAGFGLQSYEMLF